MNGKAQPAIDEAVWFCLISGVDASEPVLLPSAASCGTDIAEITIEDEVVCECFVLSCVTTIFLVRPNQF